MTAVAKATENAVDVEDLLERATGEICDQSAWAFGQVWLPADDGMLRLARTWHGRDEQRFRDLRRASGEIEFAPGEGLPGRVLASGVAASATEEELSRADGLGIAAGFAFPVVTDGDVAAVLEFFSVEPQARDNALFTALDHVSRQLGQVVKRTRAEERLRSMIETLPLATYIDRAGETDGTIWVSPQMAAITSYEAHEWQADPKLFRKVLHPDDHDRVVAELSRVKDTGEALDHEYRMLRRDGSVVWIHDSAVRDPTDSRKPMQGFILDVTARREAELERDAILDRLQEQNDELRQLDSLKDEFVALVSHELRTPLTSIRGYLELMSEDTNLTPEQAHFMATIDRNAVRLQRVVGDLLFLAQVEAGKLTLEQGELDIAAVVGDAISAAAPVALAKSVALEARLDALPIVPGDRARFAQVVDNLISNAIKFTPSGGCVLVTGNADDTEIELSIADTGMGIPAHELPRLFQRFFRTERATTNAIPGSGLGLAIAKAIVEGHGGRITVESVEGAGTMFGVFLPTR